MILVEDDSGNIFFWFIIKGNLIELFLRYYSVCRDEFDGFNVVVESFFFVM